MADPPVSVSDNVFERNAEPIGVSIGQLLHCLPFVFLTDGVVNGYISCIRKEPIRGVNQAASSLSSVRVSHRWFYAWLPLVHPKGTNSRCQSAPSTRRCSSRDNHHRCLWSVHIQWFPSRKLRGPDCHTSQGRLYHTFTRGANSRGFLPQPPSQMTHPKGQKNPRGGSGMIRSRENCCMCFHIQWVTKIPHSPLVLIDHVFV